MIIIHCNETWILKVDIVETVAAAIEEVTVADIVGTEAVAIEAVIAAVIVEDIVEEIGVVTAEGTVEVIGEDIAATEVEAIGVVIEEVTAAALTAVMEIGVVTVVAVVEVVDMTDPSMKLGRVIAAAAPQTTTTDAHAVMTVTGVRHHQSAKGDTNRSLPEATEAHLLVDHHRLITTK